MATIKVEGEFCTVTLSEPDYDGDYEWVAACGVEADVIRPLDEAVEYASQHADDSRHSRKGR